MTEEFNLSKYMRGDLKFSGNATVDGIPASAVREFVRRLKENHTKWWNGDFGLITFTKMIDKLAGDELSK